MEYAANDPRAPVPAIRPTFHRDLFETLLYGAANDNAPQRLSSLLPPVAERRLVADDFIEALLGRQRRGFDKAP